jgi:hypothetical protein
MNQKLAEARILAARKMPYMTHQVMSLIPVERRGLGTMAVDEYGRLYFDPAFLEERDLNHLAFVVPHASVLVKAPADFSNVVLQVHRNITAAA